MTAVLWFMFAHMFYGDELAMHACMARLADYANRLGGLFDGLANDCKNDHDGSGWNGPIKD